MLQLKLLCIVLWLLKWEEIQITYYGYIVQFPHTDLEKRSSIVSEKQTSHLVQVCGKPGSAHVWRILWVWMRWCSFPRTAGCQTAG